MGKQPKNHNPDLAIFKWIACILAVVMLHSGCSSVRFPTIDPSGSRIFQPCGTQSGTPAATGTKGCCLLGKGCKPGCKHSVFQPQPFTAPPMSPPQMANPQGHVQPAFQHPATPPPCNAPVSTNTTKKHYVPKVTGHKTPGQKGQIILTPSRIVAPVGSEVVVLAGICGEGGRFIKNQPLEWMLSNNSVGELIEVGGQQHPTFNQLIPPTSKKFSGQYAKGRTGLKRIVLSRGTPTPLDDIELAKGQTFVSVASSSPGTTYVTALAPNAEGWDRRRTSTTIHWVDGQWSVPAPSRATAGTVHPLTTVVSRTDGNGLKGWDTRYAIVGGAPAEFAPTGSQTATATTDNNGQATVQIRQPAGKFEPGVTQVRVDIVRPPIFGEPELVVESGLTTVTWSAPALTIRAIGPRKSEIDEPFNYRVEITNPGDQISRDVVVRTKNLDDGIEFISSTPKPTEYGRQFEWTLGDIAPGSPAKVIEIQMKSKKPGNVGMCFEVASATDRLQTEACAETEIVQPCIGYSINGPATATVGENISFNLAVENRCDEPLENIVILVNYDPGLVRPGKSNPAQFTNPILQVGENQSLPNPLTFVAQSPGTHCFTVEIRARGVQPQFDRRCIEVKSANGAAAAPGTGAAGDGNSPIGLSLRPTTALDGKPAVEALISNRGTTPLDKVALVNRMSDSITPFGITQELMASSRTFEDKLLLVDLGRLNPGQQVKVEISYEVLKSDPNAFSEITVSTPSGESATRSVQMNQAGAGNNGAGIAPNFDGINGGQIGIPADNAPIEQGALAVEVQTIDPTIGVGQQSRVSFTVENKSRQSFRNVDIRVLVPNSLSVEGLSSEMTNLGFVERFRITTIKELRAGEAITWTLLLNGRIAGPARLEVQATSDDTSGIASGSDVVEIR